LVGLTEPGQHVYKRISEVIREIKSIKQVSDEFSHSNAGELTIATTHTQARYKLPSVVQAFMAKYPDVKLNIHQGNPTQVTDQVVKGEADIGIATESISQNEKLFCLPCYTWNRCLV
ncbi:MAG TPA: transcriptional regulator CysB, partial [Methylophilaceae bacterium]|nr:transcriptional regulator CysB [Methylophilaceae bacterium]